MLQLSNLLLLLFAGALAVAAADVAKPNEYENLCEAIATHAQAASRAYNSGDTSKAQKHVERAEAAFKRAVAIDGDQPYAYMNYGNFLANANRFDEALDLLHAAMERLQADANADAEAVEYVRGSVRRALYGRASMNRDMVYQEGQGNVTAAWLWALEQLPISPFPPRTLHDIATMELMMCDTDPLKCKSARERLQQAQQSSAIQYMSARAKSMPAEAQHACHASAGVISGSNWPRCPEVSQSMPPSTALPLPPGLLALTVAPPLRLIGRDGMLLLDDVRSSCACNLLSPASDPLLDVFSNVASNQEARERQSSTGNPSYLLALPLLSLVQFATRSFYHWMCEALPRLVVAQAVWGMPSSSTYNVLIPTAPPSFMTQSLRALGVTSPTDYRRSLHLAKAPLLFVTWTTQSLASNETSGFSLAHPSALQMLRTRLLDGMQLQPLQRPSIVLASRGGDVGMRNFEEPALIAALSSALPDYDVIVANGSQPLLQNLALFAAASAVVGAHGGALANIVVCAAETPVVEIGFASEASWHYEHVANALQLRYVRVLAHADPLLRSVGAARISVDIAAVVTRLRQLMQRASSAEPASSNVQEEL